MFKKKKNTETDTETGSVSVTGSWIDKNRLFAHTEIVL